MNKQEYLKSLNYPLPVDESWFHNSASTIQQYQTCPRKYFFRKIWGLRTTGSNKHLIFGSAIHSALEALSTNKGDLRGEDLQTAVFATFLLEYRKAFSEEQDEHNKPKDPATAYDALGSYIAEYHRNDQRENTIAVEFGGSFPISDDREIFFRMDKLFIDSDTEELTVRDYKTGSRKERVWALQWDNKLQPAIYMLAASHWFQPTRFFEIRGIFLYKSFSRDRQYGNIDFLDHIVTKTDSDLEATVFSLNYWMDCIEQDLEDLASCTPDDPFLKPFQMVGESCSKYGGCPFIDICTYYPNPLSMLTNGMLSGYDVEFWSPAHEAGNATIVKGMTPEQITAAQTARDKEVEKIKKEASSSGFDFEIIL